MMYTIGQVSKMFNLPISTLRYYDNLGLFPDMQRTSGIRKFSRKELETLRIIECLKRSGLKMDDIKHFIDLSVEGPATYKERQDLFEKQKQNVEKEIDHLNRILAMINFKCWYYQQALQDGNEDRLHEMLPDKLPSDIQKLYDKAHEK
ncbi:MAG: MerR family transcriptional regulator [Erysipelotrichaceae bacterium]